MKETVLNPAASFEPVQVAPKITGGKIRVPKVAELVAETIRNRILNGELKDCLLYTSPSPRDQRGSRMPSSA